jgi:hypothetical protein
LAATLAWARLYPRRLSLCEIAENPSAYDGKLVRIETTASVHSWGASENYITIGEAGCTGSGVRSDVRLDPDMVLSREVDEFVNSPALEIREARIVVEGVFDEWATMGCFAPQFGIKNATMILISPVTSGPLPTMPAH